MSLIQSAKINGHDPYAYFKDVLELLPIQRASWIGELLRLAKTELLNGEALMKRSVGE